MIIDIQTAPEVWWFRYVFGGPVIPPQEAFGCLWFFLPLQILDPYYMGYVCSCFFSDSHVLTGRFFARKACKQKNNMSLNHVLASKLYQTLNGAAVFTYKAYIRCLGTEELIFLENFRCSYFPS